MDYATDKKRFEEVIEKDGVKVLIDPKAAMFLVNTEMDFVEDNVRAEFVFNNPNTAGECGCGESVTFDREKLAENAKVLEHTDGRAGDFVSVSV